MQTFRLTIIGAILCAFSRLAGAQTADRPTVPAGTVTLSLTEYNRLIDLASGIPPPMVAAPMAAVLARADLRIRVENDRVRGVFALSGEVLHAGVARVRLLSAATLLDARAAGASVPLVSDGNGHAALLPGPGPFSLTLEWGAPLTIGPGRGSFLLPVPPAGSAHATIDVPGEQADVHVSPGVITRRSTSAGRTLVEVTLDPDRSSEVWWSMRDSLPTPIAREVRTLADVRTLVTLGESDVRLVGLIDLVIVQGEPREIEVRLPPDYELTSVSGSSLDRSDVRAGLLVLSLADPTPRRHQFLVSLERAHPGGSFAFETGLLTIPGAQRERGEVAIEGDGTLELTTGEAEGLQRIDVRELNPALVSLVRQPLLSAYRYQRTAAAPPTLALNVKRFADAAVLAAVADRAVATTLVTVEGRALTEVSLWLTNRAQPFLKVDLPAGASIVSVEVAGEAAKPLIGTDGTRVPLLRPGFRPSGVYTVSFVYLHAGAPFARKGDMQMTLPRMDLPVGLVEWEVFVPDRYSVRRLGGNVIARHPNDGLTVTAGLYGTGSGGGTGSGSGAGIGSVSETVIVSSESPQGRTRDGIVRSPDRNDRNAQQQASANVINLQKRAAGVLPVRVEVPRAGTSHRFVKPLVVDQETVVTFRYKTR